MGAGFYPLSSLANILSIFGSKANAESFENLKNSQNMDLLEANVSFLSIKDSKSKGEEVLGDSNLVVSNNALLPTTTPTEALGIGGNDFESLEEDISIYIVHKGDTVDVVAKMFGVSPDTILSANDLTKGSTLKEGQVLLILPFSGVEHTVEKGETLKGIATKYKVDIEDIMSANDIDSGTSLAIGEKLLIPGGGLLVPKSSSNITKSGGGKSNVPLIAGYFKNPVPGALKSRGVKPGHKGVDLAAPTGTPIYAAAAGNVLIARTGWNGGFGNYVVIQHPNGVKTLYAHMSRVGTTPGVHVDQGDLIGYVGSTGHSTGPHLHFETIGAKNPF